VTAAIGLAIGCGYLQVAVFTFLVVMFDLHVLGRWEKRMESKDRYTDLALRFSGVSPQMASLRDALRAHGLDVLEHTVDWDATGTTYRRQLHHRAALDAESLTNSLTQRFRPAGLVEVRWCQ